MWIGCLGPLTAILMLFHGSKKILNSSLASLMVMSLHQAFGSDFRYVFPMHFILSNCSLILACLASGCLWMASWTRVTSGSKLKVKGPQTVPTDMHIRKCFKNPLQRDRNRAGWERYVSMRKNQTCVVQVLVPVAKGCLECFGTMWCSTSMDFICRDLNQCQLCTVLAKKVKWLAFYP